MTHLKYLIVECPEPVEGLYYVYILYCNNDSFYVGFSNNVEKRIKVHQSNNGARYTKQNKPIKIVYVEGPLPQIDAVKRERQIKRWSKAKKEALILSDIIKLKNLSSGK